MKEWLCKEYVVKRKRWTVIIDVILESIIMGVLLYYLVKDCSDAIAWLFTEVSNNNAAFDFVWILMPFILITIAMVKFGFYVANDNGSISDLLNTKKEKSIKATKGTKTTKKAKKR